MKDLGATSRSIDQLVRVSTPAGFDEAGPSSGGGLDLHDAEPGLVNSAVRALRSGPYGGITISAQQFDGAVPAHSAATQYAWEALGSSVSVQVLDEPQGAYAIVVGGFDWTYVQPSSVGPQLVRVTLLYGDVVVRVHTVRTSPRSDGCCVAGHRPGGPRHRRGRRAPLATPPRRRPAAVPTTPKPERLHTGRTPSAARPRMRPTLGHRRGGPLSPTAGPQ